jgi:DNA-binding NtrC family response regulator
MNDRRPTVLIVDDEAQVTMSMRDLLLVQTDYRIVTHTSVCDALSAAGSLTIDLVIADYLMPEMDGLTFLTRFKEIQPQTIRVLMTGSPERDEAIQASKKADLYHFLEKPWNNDYLLAIVRNGIEKRALLRALEMKAEELAQANASLKSIRTELIKAFI